MTGWRFFPQHPSAESTGNPFLSGPFAFQFPGTRTVHRDIRDRRFSLYRLSNRSKVDPSESWLLNCKCGVEQPGSSLGS
jgi:hypothetical protein